MELILIVAAGLVAVGGAVAAVRLALSRTRESLAASNQVVPGHPTRAPQSWAGSHETEARLHRRLRDAMTALRANEHFDDDGALIDVRVELEHQALSLDDRLVAVSNLPLQHKVAPLDEIADVVTLIEQTVAELASRSVAESRPVVEAALALVRERSSLIDQVRAQLDELPEAEPQAQTPPPPGEPGPQQPRPGT